MLSRVSSVRSMTMPPHIYDDRPPAVRNNTPQAASDENSSSQQMGGSRGGAQQPKLLRAGSFTVVTLREPAVPVAEWVTKQDQEIRTTITVTEPRLEVQGTGNRRSSTSIVSSLFMAKKTIYIVTTVTTIVKSQPITISTRRTYDDFVMLRSLLTKRFPGAVVPPLAESTSTKLVGSQSDAFVRKRMRMLEMFAQTVADHPFLRNDRTYEAFFLSKAEFDESAIADATRESEGTLRWQQALQVMSSRPKNFFELLDAVQDELRASKQALLAVKTAAKEEIARNNARMDAEEMVSSNFRNWLAIEQAAQSPLAAGVFMDMFEKDGDDAPSKTIEVSLSQALQELTVMCNDYVAALRMEYGEYQATETIVDATRFEIAVITNWLEEIEAARAADRKVRAASQELSNAESSLAKTIAGSAAAEGGKRRIADAKVALKEAQIVFSRYERGMMSVELMRFTQGRVLRTLRLKESLAEMHWKGSVAISKAWKRMVEVSAPPPPPPPPPPAPAPVAPAPDPAPTLVEPPPPPPQPSGPIVVTATTSPRLLASTQSALELLKQSNEALIETTGALLDANNKDGGGINLVDVVEKKYWALAYTLFSFQLFLALMFLVRGQPRDAIPVLSLSLLTMGSAHVVHLAWS